MTQIKQFSRVFWTTLILSSTLFISCKDSAIDREIASSGLELQITRLDQPLFDSTKPLAERHQMMMKSSAEFYTRYFSDVLQLGDPRDSLATDRLSQFVNYQEWVFAQTQIDSVFPDLHQLEQDFSHAFGRLKTMFPQRSTPELYLLNTGYNYGVYPDLQLPAIGIGAEFYLGAENTLVQRLPNEIFPAYMRAHMRPGQVLPATIKGWLLSSYGEAPSKVNLLNLMVTYGKIMYTLHLSIPEVPEHEQFAYSTEQLQWCQAHELDIWQAIVRDKLLYVTDRKTLTDWTGRGPFTRGFSEESPAELAYFMGKQMVKDYMAENPDVSLEELVLVPASVVLRAYAPD